MTHNIRIKTLKPGTLIPATFDYIFTGIFNNPDNIDIIEEFLACVLNLDIELLKGNIYILSRHLPIQNKKMFKLIYY